MRNNFLIVSLKKISINLVKSKLELIVNFDFKFCINPNIQFLYVVKILDYGKKIDFILKLEFSLLN
jgi:hypothetical protein